MKTQVLRATTLLSLAGVVLAGCSANSTPEASSSSSSTAPTAASTSAQANDSAKLVSDFYTQAFINRDYEKAANTYLAENYIQHSPGAENGRNGFISSMKGFIDPNTDMTIETVRTISQGDLVFLQNKITIAPDIAPINSMDIFRVSDGKIVEHWDAVQDYPAETASDNTVWDDGK